MADEANTLESIREIENLWAAFGIEGTLIGVEPLGVGNIHDSFLSRVQSRGTFDQFVHQRINTHVFPDPEKLMDNVCRVTEHLKTGLVVIPARDGQSLARDPQGASWRTYSHISGVRSPATLEGASHAREAGRAVGDFHRRMGTFEAATLHKVIPGFHDLTHYWLAFTKAVEEDPRRRVVTCQDLIDFVHEHKALTDRIVQARTSPEMPRRVVHWDPKIDNILIDEVSGKFRCLVDLDTVGASTLLDDVGDLIRSAGNPAGEDPPSPEDAHIDLDAVEEILRGYLDEAGKFLEPQEIEGIATAPSMLALELGIRFLTDHIAGDIYFKARRKGLNLHRARTQFALLESMKEHEAHLNAVVEDCLSDKARDKARKAT